MYESHFGFHRRPFQACDGRSGFFESASAGRVRPALLHSLRTDLGIAVITGPAGIGKTTLLRHLRQTLSRDGRAVVCSGASLETPSHVLQTLMNAAKLRAGETPARDPEIADETAPITAPSRWQVTARLQRSGELWGPVLLLIDDAHLLPVTVLNELRAWTEEAPEGRSLVRCLVAGPLSLEEDLAQTSHADFAGRIRCLAFLEPFSTTESIACLRQQLDSAGGRGSTVMSPPALVQIASAADGLPRCLNLLADESLVIAAEKGLAQVDAACVALALTRLRHLPYHWNIRLTSDDPSDLTPAASDGQPTNRERLTAGGHTPAPRASRQPQHTASETQSVTVCEFVAPGVIEFGAPATAASRTGVATPVSHSAVSPSSPGSPPELQQLPETAEPDRQLERHQDLDEYQPLDDYQDFELHREFELPKMSDFHGVAALPDDLPEPAMWELTSLADAVPAAECQQQEPILVSSDPAVLVPDRYTWTALGRTMATDPQDSPMATLPELTEVELLVHDTRSRLIFSPAIPVFELTDQSILARLTVSVSLSSTASFSTPYLHPEPRSRRESPEAAPSSTARWRDGQLLDAVTVPVWEPTRDSDEPISETPETISIPISFAQPAGQPVTAVAGASEQPEHSREFCRDTPAASKPLLPPLSEALKALAMPPLLQAEEPHHEARDRSEPRVLTAQAMAPHASPMFSQLFTRLKAARTRQQCPAASVPARSQFSPDPAEMITE